MARVFTKTARKEYTDIHGLTIRPGDTYYSWTPYRSGTRKSLKQPKPSEVESNYTRGDLMRIEENLEDEDADFADALDSAAEDAESVAAELTSKAENIESGFQHETEQSEQFREQADEVETWVEELREAAAEVRGLWPDGTEYPHEPEEPFADDYPDEDAYQDAMMAYEEAEMEFNAEFTDIEEQEEEARRKFEEVASNCPSI